jgi:hypothetical protein
MLTSESHQWQNEGLLQVMGKFHRTQVRKPKSGCAAWPKPEESYISSSYPGKTYTRWSSRSVTWSAWSSNILGQRWWWYTWTDWHCAKGLCKTNSVKERAVLQAFCRNLAGHAFFPPPVSHSQVQMTSISCTNTQTCPENYQTNWQHFEMCQRKWKVWEMSQRSGWTPV